jgi:hypothetical protein
MSNIFWLDWLSFFLLKSSYQVCKICDVHSNRRLFTAKLKEVAINTAITIPVIRDQATIYF